MELILNLFLIPSFSSTLPDQDANFESIISRDWKMRQLVSGIEKRFWKLFHKIQRSAVGASKISVNPLNHTHTFLYFNGFFLMRLVFKLSGFLLAMQDLLYAGLPYGYIFGYV